MLGDNTVVIMDLLRWHAFPVDDNVLKPPQALHVRLLQIYCALFEILIAKVVDDAWIYLSEYVLEALVLWQDEHSLSLLPSFLPLCGELVVASIVRSYSGRGEADGLRESRGKTGEDVASLAQVRPIAVQEGIGIALVILHASNDRSSSTEVVECLLGL